MLNVVNISSCARLNGTPRNMQRCTLPFNHKIKQRVALGLTAIDEYATIHFPLDGPRPDFSLSAGVEGLCLLGIAFAPNLYTPVLLSLLDTSHAGNPSSASEGCAGAPEVSQSSPEK
jgi:hypothetical protein